MEKETAKLLEQLANKLGTTTEYLWRVLIKQAYIDAVTTLIYFLIVCLFGYVLLRLHLYFGKEKELENGRKSHSIYYEAEEMVVVPMVLIVVTWLIIFTASFFSLENVINGFFNPEYWALNKILEQVG